MEFSFNKKSKLFSHSELNNEENINRKAPLTDFSDEAELLIFEMNLCLEHMNNDLYRFKQQRIKRNEEGSN